MSEQKHDKIALDLANVMLPCPFCGSVATIEQESLGKNYYPRCSNEGCIAYNMEHDGEFGTIYVSFETKHEAILAWNKRA